MEWHLITSLSPSNLPSVFSAEKAIYGNILIGLQHIMMKK